jgi:hypothetical protein
LTRLHRFTIFATVKHYPEETLSEKERAQKRSLGDWLRRAERDPNPYSQFGVVDVRQKQTASEEHKAHLAGLCRTAMCDPHFLQELESASHTNATRQFISFL